MSDRRLAVLIGSGSYPDEPKLQDLRCPSRDVDGLARALRERGSFESVTVVKDAPHYEALLEVNRTLKAAGKEDLVFIYYSGHGKLDLANRLYLCTPNTVVGMLEATAIPVNSIRDYADVAACHRIALMLDCCFSGAVGDVFARSSVDDQPQLVSRGRGTYIMTASTAVQVALEKEQDEYSAFTKHVIEGLQTEAADVDEDGAVTMDELYQYVHAQLKREGFQEPMKWAINVRGELVIARTGKSPRKERRNRIRERLLTLANDGTLPDRVLSRALGLLGSERVTIPERDAPRDELLDRLDKKLLSVGDFVDQWLRLEWTEKAPVGSESSSYATRPESRGAHANVGPASVASQPEKAEARQTTADVSGPRSTVDQVPRPADASSKWTTVELSGSSLWASASQHPVEFWRTFGASVTGLVAGSAAVFAFTSVAEEWLVWLGRDHVALTLLFSIGCGAGAGLAQQWSALRSADVRWFGATALGWALGTAAATPIAWTHPFSLPWVLVGVSGAGAAALLQSAALGLQADGTRSWLLISCLPLAGAVPFAFGNSAWSIALTIVALVLPYLAVTSAGLTRLSVSEGANRGLGWTTALRAARLPLSVARAASYAVLTVITIGLLSGIVPAVGFGSPAVFFMLLGLFLGLELGPLLMRRDTPWVRLGGAAAGCFFVAGFVVPNYGTYVPIPDVIALFWTFVLGSGVLTSSVLVQRSSGPRGLIILAATVGSALAAAIVLPMVASWNFEGAPLAFWGEGLYGMGLPTTLTGALVTGAALGAWVGLREVLPSGIGVRGELAGSVSQIRRVSQESRA